MKQTPQEKILKIYYDDNKSGGSSRWLVAPETVELHVKQLIKAEREKILNELIKIEKEKFKDEVHCTCLAYAIDKIK